MTTTRPAFYAHIRAAERLLNAGCVTDYDHMTHKTTWKVAGRVVGTTTGRVGESTKYEIKELP